MISVQIIFGQVLWLHIKFQLKCVRYGRVLTVWAKPDLYGLVFILGQSSLVGNEFWVCVSTSNKMFCLVRYGRVLTVWDKPDLYGLVFILGQSSFVGNGFWVWVSTSNKMYCLVQSKLTGSPMQDPRMCVTNNSSTQ